MLHKGQSREVRSKIRGILMGEWDPIGVNDVAAADEYDSYINGIYDLLEQGGLNRAPAHTCGK